MTHDELVNEVVYGEQTRFALANALRAVVELHKPVEMPYARVEGTLTCSYCSGMCHSRSGLSCDDCPPVYPCPTIQAIEKELE